VTARSEAIHFEYRRYLPISREHAGLETEAEIADYGPVPDARGTPQNHSILGKNYTSIGQAEFQMFYAVRLLGILGSQRFLGKLQTRLADPFTDFANSTAIFALEAPCAHQEPHGAGLVSESPTILPEPSSVTSQNPV
jgi:hypothetical protein